MTETGLCPNCNLELTAQNPPISDDSAKAINLFTINKSPGFCKACSPILAKAATIHRADWITELKNQVEMDLQFFPVNTLQAPYHWDYSVIKSVTAQTINLRSSVYKKINSSTEKFGIDTPVVKTEITQSEDLCLTRLKIEALNNGANAIIDLEISYPTVGPYDTTIMICATGTAIKLNNMDILPADVQAGLERLKLKMAKLTEGYKYQSIII